MIDYLQAHWFYFLLWGVILPAFTHYQVGRIVAALLDLTLAIREASRRYRG